MGKCKYTLNLDNTIFDFASEKELNDFVLLNKIPGKNSIKFSKELSRANLVSKAIDDLSTESKKSDFRDKEILSAYEFLKTKHDFGKGEMLLTPYFDQDNYANNIVIQEKLTGEEATKRKEQILSDLNEKDLRSISELWIKIIKDSIIQKNSKVTSSDTFNEWLDEFIKRIETYNNEKYSEDQKVLIKDNLKNQVSIFLNTDLAKSFTKVNTRISNKIGKVKDEIDLISIDKLGIPNIVKFSVSRKQYINWDSAKSAQFDYRLAIQRQLLESAVSTKKSSLYVVPFHIPTTSDGKLDLVNFKMEQLRLRDQSWISSDATSTDTITGKIKILIPGNSTNFHIEETKADKLNKELLQAIIGSNYTISSKKEIQNKENLIKSIVQRKKDQSADHYVLYNKLTGKPMKIDSLEELDKVVTEYIKNYNESKNSKIYEIRKKIKLAIENGEQHLTYGNTILSINLDKYLDGEWELVENDVFLNQDLLVFRNIFYKTIEVVSITSNPLSSMYNLGLGTTLLGKFKSDNEVIKDKNILKATTGNIEMLKSLIILNNSPELFEGYKLGTIKVLNYLENKAEYFDLEPVIYNFNKLFNIANKNNELSSIDNFSNKKITLVNRAEQLYQEVLDKMLTSSYSDIRDVAKGITDDVVNDKLDWLFSVQKKIVSISSKVQNNPEVVSKQWDKNSLDYLYYLVSEAIRYYTDVKFKNDYNQPRLGITWGDAGHLVKTALTGKDFEFNKDGSRIVGLLGGSLFTTASSHPSEDIKHIFDFIALGHTEIRQLFTPFANKSTTWTNKYYEECGRSGLEKQLIGKANQYHEVFFVKNKQTNKIDDSFMFKNPYDMDVNLKPHERNYLKKMLWEFYKDKGDLSEDQKNLTVEEAEKLSEFKSFISTDLYFKAPLKKRNDITLFKSLTSNGVRRAVGKMWEEVKDSLDERELTDIHRQEFESKEKMAFQMANEFKISDEKRDELIHEYGVDHFEINLDTLLLEQRFSYIRENVMNKTLQIVNALAMSLKYNAYSTGRVEESVKAFEDLYKQIRVSVYGSVVMDKEIQPLVASVKQIQKIASVMFITMRPLLTIKELLVGGWKNYSYAYSQIWGDQSFKIEHMNKAYEKVLFSTKQSSSDFNVIQHFNRWYAIANMDINRIVDKTKVDRKGFIKFFSEHLYWLNGAGDYVNRLSVFIAMTMKDGSFDAHYIDSNGEFKYDPSKDNRFKTYFAKREQYKFRFSDGKDIEYDNQRSLYLSMLDDFNAERNVSGESQLTEKDLLPRAYTHKQRESIKTFADTAYGFYDTETKSAILNTAVGSIFGQFLTYLPSKIEFYFSKEKMSKYGDYRQKIGLDNGVEKPLWLKNKFDDQGNYLGSEETFEDTGIPSKEFENDPWEGVLYSLARVVRDITKGNYGETTEQRKRRAIIAMNDLMMGLIVMSLLKALLTEFKESDETNEAQFLATKVFYKMSSEFNPFALFTSLKWEPAFVSALIGTKNILASLFDEKSNTEKMIRNTIRATEIIPTITY